MPREGNLNITATVGCAGVLAGCVADAVLVYALVANTGAPQRPGCVDNLALRQAQRQRSIRWS